MKRHLLHNIYYFLMDYFLLFQGDQNQSPDKEYVPYKPGEGDWDCSICKKLNFRKRTDCFGCGLPRDGEQEIQQDNRR